MLECFLNQPVTVDKPVGSIFRFLKQADKSKHNGIGCLLLHDRHGWVLVKTWISIKRKV